MSRDVTVMMVRMMMMVVVWVQGLMRELELREKKMNTVQATGDKLLKDGHPARKTIEVRISHGKSLENRRIQGLYLI